MSTTTSSQSISTDPRNSTGPATPMTIQKLNHDLRSPLSAVLGFAALLEDEGLSAEERTEYLSAIKRAAEQMLLTLNSAQMQTVASPAPSQPRVVVPALLTSRRVLLADDEPRLRQLTQFCLEKGGATVIAAADGQEAVERALTEPFDVIRLDMEMPVLDGFDAARLLRSRGFKGPIVAFTAHASPAEWERCLEAGCTRYVSKPFEADHLVRQLAAAIERPDETD